MSNIPLPPAAALDDATSSWLCNKCGHKFTDMEAGSVEVSSDSEEVCIACPKCWANVWDEWGSLTSSDDPQYDWRARHESYLKYLYVENPPKLVWNGEEWIPEPNAPTTRVTD